MAYLFQFYKMNINTESSQEY